MSINCPHCHASRANLQLISEIIKGERARCIVCTRCGQRVYEDDKPPRQPKNIKKQEH